MRFPLPGATAVLVAAVGLAAGAAGASASAGRPCPPPGAHRIAHDRRLIVYSTGGGLPSHPVEACLVAGGRRMTLLAKSTPGSPGLGRGLTVKALSGSIVAYLVTSFGVDSGSTDLVVADVASRKVLRDVPAGKYVDAGFLGSESVTRVVLGPEGALAWSTTRRERQGSTADYSVHAAARTGPVSVLDEGPDIGAGSLALHGRTLSWSHGAVERTATLP